MNESEAKAALRAQGIRNPSRQLVEDYMRVQQAEEWTLEVPERSSAELAGERSQPNSAPERTERPHPSSESTLAPLLSDRAELVRERGPRRAGRPRVLAPWFNAVATAMADGTSLRQALSICGIYGLTPKQPGSLYRNRAFRAIYRAERQKWQSELGIRHHRKQARPKGCKGGDCLGASLRAMLRSL